jgi:hypothetical protein
MFLTGTRPQGLRQVAADCFNANNLLQKPSGLKPSSLLQSSQQATMSTLASK